MAEFQEVAKHWKRMCSDMSEMDGCEDCPIVTMTHGTRCGDVPSEMKNIEEIEKAVTDWAAENPEPVYPTWWEYLRKKYPGRDVYPDEIGEERIPADIAQKLGIEPKEG